MPRALLPMGLEVSEALPRTQSWASSPNKSQPPSSTTGLQWCHMLHNLVLLQHGGCPQRSRVLHSCQPRSCFIIIFTVLLLFWEFKSVLPRLMHRVKNGVSLPFLLQPNELPFSISKSDEHQTTSYLFTEQKT